ncbi:hypothetical protein [Sphingomonas sp. TREG-RG-20F-R18-01]|nr:hypothetical protein [Sphingomonas sp. TREG-RG-20F-R18-01]
MTLFVTPAKAGAATLPRATRVSIPNLAAPAYAGVTSAHYSTSTAATVTG